MGRFLLTLVTISLLTMPVTQHLWNWDRFLHGGQDFESSVLMILMILCLALLLVQSCKRSVEWLLARWPLLWCFCRSRFLGGVWRSRTVAALRTGTGHGPVSGTYTVPLRI
jgi:hypothetical protein